MRATMLLRISQKILIFLAVQFCVVHNQAKPSEPGGPNKRGAFQRSVVGEK